MRKRVTFIKRSQRAFKGWTGHYRRRIDELENAIEWVVNDAVNIYPIPHKYNLWVTRLRIALEEHKHGK